MVFRGGLAKASEPGNNPKHNNKDLLRKAKHKVHRTGWRMGDKQFIIVDFP